MRQRVGQYMHTLFLLIIQMTQHGSNGTGFTPNKLPLWTWECINNRCVPTQATSPNRLQSLEMCNMLCASMQLWPQPTGPVSLSTTAIPVRADLFQLKIVSAPSKAVHEHLEEAYHLFTEDLHHMERNAGGFAEWRAVAIHITVNGSGDPRMLLTTDESYELVMHPQFAAGGPLTAKITAKSFCGARHGLETLLQLVWMDTYVSSLFILEAAAVEDDPRFSYRGLLLDTARNFFPVPDIMRTIDGMAASKLNTFHWHISDSQAFPLRLSSVPQLAMYGAYGSSAVYTADDVRKIVHRARLRGIRVLIEVNTPAHVGSAWGWGSSMSLGDLVQCADLKSWEQYCNEPPCGQLNPRNPHVYDLLEAVYGEIMHLTGVDDIFHIGGDDFSYHCWQTHFPKIDPNALLLEYTHSALERLGNINGKLPNLTIMWTSPLSENLKTDLRDYVAHIALQTHHVISGGVTKQLTEGIRTILSQVDPWDLNTGMGDWYEDANGAPYNSWQRIYEYRPWSRGAGVSNVLGGVATVWSATLSVGGLDGRIWPRGAAVAERLWSDRPEGATRPVHVRLDVHRARLAARGIRATPIWSMWCSHYTYTCG